MLYGYQTLRLVSGKEIVERFGGDVQLDSTGTTDNLLDVSLARQIGAKLSFAVEGVAHTLPNSAIVCPWEGYLLPDELCKQLVFPTNDAEVRMLVGAFSWNGPNLNEATDLLFRVMSYRCEPCFDVVFTVRYRSIQLRNELAEFAQQHPKVYAYDAGHGDSAGVYYLGFRDMVREETPFITHAEIDCPDNCFVLWDASEKRYQRQAASVVYQALRDAKNQQLDNLYWETHADENQARMFLEQNTEEFEKLNERLRQVKESGFVDRDTKLVYIDNRYEHSPYIEWGGEAFLANEALLGAIQDYVQFMEFYQHYEEKVRALRDEYTKQKSAFTAKMAQCKLSNIDLYDMSMNTVLASTITTVRYPD